MGELMYLISEEADVFNTLSGNAETENVCTSNCS